MKMILFTALAACPCLIRKSRRMRVRHAALLFSLVGIPFASANSGSWTDGLYLKTFGGFNFVADGDISQGGLIGDGSYDPGQLFGAAIGKEFTPNWALELEFFYRSADIDSISAGGPFAGFTEGDFASTNLMLNGIYTFTQPDGSALWGKFTPYVGAGVGFLQEADMDVTVGGVEREFDDNFLFAAQVLAGVSYEITPSWSIYGEARYHFAGEIELDPGAGGGVLKADYNGLSCLIGLRYKF
jgi:opacity protein-like surface antigen